MKPAIIIPTYCEADNIESLLKDIRVTLPKATIIVVDDNSPDGTAKLVNELDDKHIILISQPNKSGRGAAVIKGYTHALKDPKVTHYIEMDGDRSHQVKELPLLLKATEEADMVIASRYLKESRIIGWPLSRHLFSRLANWYAKKVLEIKGTDLTNGLRCYTRHALMTIDLSTTTQTGYALLMEMHFLAQQKKLKVTELPSTFVNRLKGSSNTTLKEIINAARAPKNIRYTHHK